jgi:CheY-like chemotaxis protein
MPAFALNGVSVLVVDDDPAIRALITTLLKRTNATVDCANNGDVAIMRLGRQSYSVIVLDLMLPKVDGFEVLDRVASTKPDLLKRVIVLTAVARNKLEPLERRKVWRVMRKPFDIDDFTAAVAECAAQPEVQHAS